MTNEQINIAIAEECPTIVGLGADGIYYLRTGLVEFDPCNDLNTTHEAEGTLTKQQQEEYDYQLSEITAPITGERWSLLHANARQRAEAFLRTVGKWKEAAK